MSMSLPARSRTSRPITCICVLSQSPQICQMRTPRSPLAIDWFILQWTTKLHAATSTFTAKHVCTLDTFATDAWFEGHAAFPQSPENFSLQLQLIANRSKNGRISDYYNSTVTLRTLKKEQSYASLTVAHDIH
eukprot:5579273-Amphidinium_carterae.1